ncbi:protein phosphatase 2C domain-containing protein [Leptolyngbya sp. BC1307]|uniref:PP2C family protein-serine/threonine phosphatase n=1 Tax=Leptolyngbya sp. BC1307 TaxID=2029589 RepID=UPI000EFC89EF|nr:protein phosphatase 2C domain-containing protein [Leptolyngbya sp. BC1307]
MNGEESKYPFRQYVWALGHGTNKIPIGDRVDGRYQVVGPSIWLDTQPEQPPKAPDPVPNFALPYLKAYAYQLNLPGVYGICHQASGEAVLLLSNVPVNHQGQLMPVIGKVWPEASAFRQLYWLWQMVGLWEPLKSFGAAASLLKKSNIRVEAWRVRLIGLSVNPGDPPLSELGLTWQRYYLPGAKPAVAELLVSVCEMLQADEPDLTAIKAQINEQLLQAAAGAAIEFQIAGATSTGPKKPRNEDACYPSRIELKRTSAADLPLLPRLAIVCDGVGGHAGGEVASQMVVRSLQLQLRSLLTEAMEQEQAIPPRVVIDQIEAAIRVANNLVAQQNDQQGRADRQRMGTTLVMALILPQRIDTPAGPAEVNELYLTHIGDSRAYWITPKHCQLLTVDDDIAGREVSAGHSFYAQALQRSDASALTQALGLREFDQLRPHTQRFLFDSDGVLLLCSDGLSDNHQVEASWANYIGLIVQQIVPLEAAVDAWIELANQKNGHDNVAVVLVNVYLPKEMAEPGAATGDESSTRLGREAMPQLEGGRPAGGVPPQPFAEMTAASRALLYGETEDDDTPLTAEEMAAVETPPAGKRSVGRKLITALLAVAVLGAIGAIGWLLWRTFEPLKSEPPLPEDQPALPDAPEPDASESEGST